MTLTQPARLARQRLSAELRRLRKEARRTCTNLAQAAEMSQSKLSKIENNMQLPSVLQVERLLTALSASPEVREELIALVTQLHTHDNAKRVILHRGPAGHHQRATTRIEERATTSRVFQPLGVPPLLQSESYLRATLSALSTPNQNAALGALRARRTHLDDPAKKFLVVMTEAALRWRVGPAKVMCEQIDYLAQTMHRPNVQIGVIPQPAVTGFADPAGFALYDDTAVVVNVLVGSATITDKRDVLEYSEVFGRLDRLAFHGDQFGELLAHLSRDHHAHG